MKERPHHHTRILLLCALLFSTARPASGGGLTISPSPYWKNQISFPSDAFCARGTSKDSAKWVKFTILQAPYDSNVVYFQDSRTYVFHYDFAVAHLDPFAGMTPAQFNAATLFERNQLAILGTVIVPPTSGTPAQARFNEYGIQLVRQDPYAREQIRDLFNRVKAHVTAPSDVQAFYFPTYEQQAVAAANREWFESQGISLGSIAQWEKGNICYSQGWALGRLKFFTASDINKAYQEGLLKPEDILLTDGVPAELPFVAGVISLVPATPNCHVAILTRAYAVPFVHLTLADDIQRVRDLTGHRIIFSAYFDSYGICSVRLIDGDRFLDDRIVADILKLKQPAPLDITPMTPYGALGVSCDGLTPSDMRYVGGKAANFGLLRQAIPANSPRAIALTFDLWNAFLDQSLVRVPRIDLAPGEHRLIWADGDPALGPTHAGFKLAKSGECVALFDTDGRTLIDAVDFGPQSTDVSYGRSVDGGDTWQPLDVPTPGGPNSSAEPNAGKGLVINELMADNKTTLEDPNQRGHHPDWIELYNASQRVICLNGMYLTDDMNEPTRWRIPPFLGGGTLRQEIAGRLSAYPSYPPVDMQGLCDVLASIRSLFTDSGITAFDEDLRTRLWAVLENPIYGLDPNVMLRFRSSTNVEDSEDFIGAGLYDSFSGCLTDDLDGEGGACHCDPNESSERGVLRAIRKVFASFYNDNAYLERLRHDVNETQVGMALLVHPSFPDETELANGVATVEIRDDGSNSVITLVTQHGAVSVTNPQDTSIPEEVTITVFPDGRIIPPSPSSIKSSSSLIPLGATVMVWRDDYLELAELLMRVSDKFRELTGKTAYTLDIEYKKVAPMDWTLPSGGLVIKQVRQVPQGSEPQTPFLIGTPTQFEVYPGEFKALESFDVFAAHRLKSRWTLQARTMILDSNSLGEQLYTQGEIEYLDNDRVCTIGGQMSQLPSAEHSFSGTEVIDRFQVCCDANLRTYHLHTTDVPTSVSATENPVYTLADFGALAFNTPFKCLTLNVEYDRPVLSWHEPTDSSNSSSGLYATTENKVYMWPCTPARNDDVYQERVLVSGGVSVKTSFYYPAPPAGLSDWAADAGSTAPLKRWGQTTLEGLTAKPIVLNGYYSRTYRPEHHNLVEHFLFEPRLEPGLSADILDELRNLDVRLIHLILDNRTGGNESKILTYGFADPQ